MQPTSYESICLSLISEPSEPEDENIFFSRDYIRDEYHFKLVNFDKNDTEDNEKELRKAIESFKKWTDINQLNLIISVTGGAGTFILPTRIKTAFKTGIAKISVSTNALIITG